MKINFHRVLLGFFENWDKSSQKKWDKGVSGCLLRIWRDYDNILPKWHGKVRPICARIVGEGFFKVGGGERPI